MKPPDLLEDIKTYCLAHQNPANVIKYSRYFKEGFDAYGLSQEDSYAKVKSILATPGVNMDLIINTSYLLMEGRKYE